MNLELRHLRTIQAIHLAGGISRAATQLNITQSALSHQVKYLEDQTGVELFIRRSKPLKLSAAGLRLLRLAERVLPEIEAAEAEFMGLQAGSTGRLYIALECHACYNWLLPVLEEFRHSWPKIEVDIRAGLAFSALHALEQEKVDLVLTADPTPIASVDFSPLFDYEPLLLAAHDHPLAKRPFIEATDLVSHTLITYPVERDKLDVYTALLTPAGLEPAARKQIELTDIILLLVAAGQGVSVLPDWVVRGTKSGADFALRRLTADGVTKRLFAATRHPETYKPYVAHFLRLARNMPVQLRRR